MSNSEQKAAELRRAALDYHEFPTPGKVAIAATKQLVNQHDLALAYSPGVAAACEEIVADPANAFRYTSRGNLVAVITNGTAVLGLGDIGPLAAKPVMEGKGVLFKKFAGIDVFDIEVNEKNLDKLIDLIAALEPTFGGINLEDIKAPDCFYVERALRSRMKIPVFHDDQHGTAIVVGAGVLNALKVSGKKIDEVKLVTSGAGAAALACLGLLVKLGIPRENIWVTDLAGVVYKGRTELMDEDKIVFAQDTPHRSLADVIAGADIFLGLSAAGVLKPEMVAKMAPRPVIFALANPTPEILPEEVHAVRNDAIVATGRTDYPNQINNVLCFPYIFRGALDSGATTITIEMEIAAVHAIAELAQAESSEVVTAAYAGASAQLRPRVPDPEAVRSAPDDADRAGGRQGRRGVGRRGAADRRHGGLPRQAADLRLRLGHDDAADLQPGQDGAEEAHRVRRGRGRARPARGAGGGRREPGAADADRPARGDRAAHRQVRPAPFGRARLRPRQHRERPPLPRLLAEYHEMTARKGVTAQLAKIEMRRRLTLIGAMLLKTGEVDGMLCGTWGSDRACTCSYIDQVIGLREGAKTYACMNGLILPGRQVMLVDTHVNYDPSAEQIAEFTVMAAEEMMRFGIKPKAALLSHSNYGTSNQPSAVKMREALALLQRARRLARGRRRDARRHRARRPLPARAHAVEPADRRGEPAGPAQHRRRQHFVQPAQDRGRRRHRDRPGAARRGAAGPYPDAVGDGAPHHQHDRAWRSPTRTRRADFGCERDISRA